MLENPGWYTPYTPYQAEIAQGRLESLLNFQTMVQGSDRDGHRDGVAARRGHRRGRGDDDVPPAADEEGAGRPGERVRRLGAVLRADDRRAARPRGAARTSSWSSATSPTCRRTCWTAPSASCCSIPDVARRGRAICGRSIGRAHDAGLLVAVATDLLALTLLVPPGEMGADAVVGNSQRFGVPLGYGGPHAAFLATRETLRPPGAGPDHRHVGRRARQARLSHGAADPRAAHPPREGDLEHLHGAGAARQHRGDVCGLPRPRRHPRDRRARPQPDPRRSRMR